MLRKFPRILFFINGALPTEGQQDEAMEYGFNVAFRNADFVASEGCLEECDGVAGEVPERYKDKPHAEEALTAWSRKLHGIKEDEAEEDKVEEEEAEAPVSAPEAPAKGKGKAAQEKPAVAEISQPEIPAVAPNAPAAPPAWVPNS